MSRALRASPRRLAVWSLFPLIASCSLFEGESEEGDGLRDTVDPAGDTGASDTSPDGITAATATGLVMLVGVSGYALAPGSDPSGDVRVTLRDEGGRELGVIDVYADPTGLSASLPSPDGLLVYHTSARLEGDRLVTMRASSATVRSSASRACTAMRAWGRASRRRAHRDPRSTLRSVRARAATT